jgi:hypothetical protein
MLNLLSSQMTLNQWVPGSSPGSHSPPKLAVKELPAERPISGRFFAIVRGVSCVSAHRPRLLGRFWGACLRRQKSRSRRQPGRFATALPERTHSAKARMVGHDGSTFFFFPRHSSDWLATAGRVTRCCLRNLHPIANDSATRRQDGLKSRVALGIRSDSALHHPPSSAQDADSGVSACRAWLSTSFMPSLVGFSGRNGEGLAGALSTALRY